jgi:hypothetical protein
MVKEANAARKNDIISVWISGILPTPCHEAKVIGKYPGGNIIYMTAPGTAQVFVNLEFKPEFIGNYYCIEMFGGPFWLIAEIVDPVHNQVDIIINNRLFKKIPVQGNV